MGRLTPGLREAGTVEFVTADAAASAPYLASLASCGLDVRAVSVPSGKAGLLILAQGLTEQRGSLYPSILESLKGAARDFEQAGGTLILLQDTGGTFQPGDQRAWLGGLTGLARTAAREFPKATVRLIDLDTRGLGPDLAAARLIEELLSGGTAPVVGLSARGRFVPQDNSLILPANRPGLLSSADVLLVTGGARGVTADCIIELARRTGARFALLGRSALRDWPEGLEETRDERALRGALARQAAASGEKLKPADLNARARALLSGAEIRDTLDAIRTAGGDAIYIPADVADRSALARAIAEAEARLGPITGLVHGAGVLADKLIREKTPEQLARVFGPKIDGLDALLSELDTSRLKTIAFFSSVAARYGNAGQSDYAMANELLNRMAWWLKASHPEMMVTSINWGPWDGGMVDDGLRAKFAEMGVALISRQAGANAFADAVLAGAACPVEIVAGAEIAHG